MIHRHVIALFSFHYKEGKSKRGAIKSVFPTYKAFPSLCFQTKWRVQIRLVDMRMTDLKTQ